jgi:hypothetical protein
VTGLDTLLGHLEGRRYLPAESGPLPTATAVRQVADEAIRSVPKFRHDELGVLVASFKDDPSGSAQRRTCALLEEVFTTERHSDLLKNVRVCPLPPRSHMFDSDDEVSRKEALSLCRRKKALLLVEGRCRLDAQEVLCRFVVDPSWCAETGILPPDHHWQSLPSFDLLRHIAEQQKRQLSYLLAVVMFTAGYGLYRKGFLSDARLLFRVSIGGFTLRNQQEAAARFYIACANFKLLDFDQGLHEFALLLALADQNVRDQRIFVCLLRAGAEAISAFGSESRFDDMENILKVLQTLGPSRKHDRDYDNVLAVALCNAIILYRRHGKDDMAASKLSDITPVLSRVHEPCSEEMRCVLGKLKKLYPRLELPEGEIDSR